MDPSPPAGLPHSSLPDFGEGVSYRSEPCTPRELFCSLFVDLEESVHYFEPAFVLACSLVGAAALPDLPSAAPDALADALVTWARATPRPALKQGHASSWPVRVAREFAPVGLADGAWLRGATLTNAIETEAGMALLKQLMTRFGDPGSSEAYVQRYAALLRSVGIPPDMVTRWEWEEATPCVDVSYELGLLGLALGLFPSALGLEAVGYNLWMAAVGPCPLLEQLAEPLRARGADLRYLDAHDRASMAALAATAVTVTLASSDVPHAAARIARGFAAAHAAYERWEAAMLGRNVPYTPREFVLEGIRRKARFSAEHHRDVSLGKHNLQALLLGDAAAHEVLLDHMAKSVLVRPGEPDKSRFMTHTISLQGPMFDAFTAAEKVELREWITSLSDPTPIAPREPAVGTLGVYGPPQDLDALARFAFARYGDKSPSTLFYYFANVDCHPASRLFARAFVERVFAKVEHVLASDPRLNKLAPPPWSERAVAQIVAAQHEKNVRSRAQSVQPVAPTDEREEAARGIQEVFDGSWLQGFADVRRADFEEYGWLFRIYASEHGDGDFSWNHCQIFRKAFAVLGPDVMLPKTDPRLYALFNVGVAALTTIAASLNTRAFMPELLGINLGIESTGVGGSYMDAWKRAAKTGERWRALAWRLHNSIDNYADGHTKWSLAAVQSFMRRVKDGSPADVERQWQRVWRLWRVREILMHGSEEERAALDELFGVQQAATAPA